MAATMLQFYVLCSMYIAPNSLSPWIGLMLHIFSPNWPIDLAMSVPGPIIVCRYDDNGMVVGSMMILIQIFKRSQAEPQASLFFEEESYNSPTSHLMLSS